MRTVKKFDITKERPKVLLVGNGITHYCNGTLDWDEAIKSMSSNDEYEETFKNIPYSIQALLFSDIDDKSRRIKYDKVFNNIQGNPDNYSPEIIETLKSIKCDALLTTNYTYEIENCFKADFNSLKSGTKRKYACHTSDIADAKYQIHNFNRFEYENNFRDVWHIHGEMRNPSSIIFTHDEYARLIERILNYNSKNGHRYLEADEISFDSWIDYLVLGDVYIIGFGMDFSEFDLWWLLGRRLREKTGRSKIVFYEPYSEKNTCKIKALKKLEVECRGEQFVLTDNKEQSDKIYKSFYLWALNNIKEAMEENCNEKNN